MAEINLLARDAEARAHPRLDAPRHARSRRRRSPCGLVEQEVLPHFDSGALTVPVAATYELDRVEEAYERFTAGGKLGKIVLLA